MAKARVQSKNFIFIFAVSTAKKKGEKDEKNNLAGTLPAYGSNRRAGGAESSYRCKQMASQTGHAERPRPGGRGGM